MKITFKEIVLFIALCVLATLAVFGQAVDKQYEARDVTYVPVLVLDTVTGEYTMKLLPPFKNHLMCMQASNQVTCFGYGALRDDLSYEVTVDNYEVPSEDTT